MVFVGYGVSAPALGYDDYGAGTEVAGKVWWLGAYLSGAPAMLPSNERAYYRRARSRTRRGVADAARAIGIDQLHVTRRSAFPLDVSVANTGNRAAMLRVDAQGQPNRGDPMRGAASLNHSGVAALLAGAPKAPADVFAGRRGQHAAGLRPGHPCVDHDALDPP
ncbi:MAG: hypothetical protein R2708_25125 [Vicinamibacterales bacterium]